MRYPNPKSRPEPTCVLSVRSSSAFAATSGRERVGAVAGLLAVVPGCVPCRAASCRWSADAVSAVNALVVHRPTSLE